MLNRFFDLSAQFTGNRSVTHSITQRVLLYVGRLFLLIQVVCSKIACTLQPYNTYSPIYRLTDFQRPVTNKKFPLKVAMSFNELYIIHTEHSH
jgi:hypothetical protein